jgi:hypothetical protein
MNMNVLDELGIPSVQKPPEKGAFMTFFKMLIFSVLALILAPVLAIFMVVKGSKGLSDVWRKVMSSKPLDRNAMRPKEVEKVIWNSEVGALYAKAVEYQIREGYCSSATSRCILKSYNVARSSSNQIPVPAQISKPDTPEGFKQKLDAIVTASGEPYLNVTVVRGSEKVGATEEDHYKAFLATLKLVQNPKYRVACNFLRGALFGPAGYFPAQILISLLGGHFSPIVAYLDDREEPLCALFDVNADYGLVLIPARNLFSATRTHDLTTGNARGLVVTELKA